MEGRQFLSCRLHLIIIGNGEDQHDELPRCCCPENSRPVDSIIFLSEVETVITSGIKSRFVILGFSTSDIILDLKFSL